MLTGLRDKTFENLQLNAGVFIENFEITTELTASQLQLNILNILSGTGDDAGVLGATIGGGSLVCEPAIRQIEADGMRYPIIGSTVNDSWTIRLTGTMKEITPNNFKRVLASCDAVKNTKGDVTTLTLRTEIKKTDYISKLCWIGDTSKGFVVIELSNVLNLDGATFTFTDRGEGTLPFNFQAHVASLSTMDSAPLRIIFFDAAS